MFGIIVVVSLALLEIAKKNGTIHPACCLHSSLLCLYPFPRHSQTCLFPWHQWILLHTVTAKQKNLIRTIKYKSISQVRLTGLFVPEVSVSKTFQRWNQGEVLRVYPKKQFGWFFQSFGQFLGWFFQSVQFCFQLTFGLTVDLDCKLKNCAWNHHLLQETTGIGSQMIDPVSPTTKKASFSTGLQLILRILDLYILHGFPFFRIEPIESSSRGNLRWPHSRGLCLFHFVFLCLLPRYLFVGLHRTLTTPLRMPDTNEALGWDSLLKIGRSLVVTVTGWGGVSTNGIPVRVCWLKSQRKFGGFFLFWAEIWLCNEIRFEFPEFYLVQQIP